MINIYTYYQNKDTDIRYIDQLIADECVEPYRTIRVCGRDIPQTLTTTLKRIHTKAIQHINERMRQKQMQERINNQGTYYTQKRYQTVPMHQCLFTLKRLDEYLATLDKWQTETDDAGLPTKKVLTYRHPYRTECVRLLSMAYLTEQPKAKR